MQSPIPLRAARSAALLLGICSGIIWPASGQPGLDQAQPFAPFLNGVFPSNTPGSTPGGSWATQNAFPGLSFPEPVRIIQHPRDNKLAVISKTGTVWIFNDAPQTTTKQVLLDLSSKTNYPIVGEGGVSGLAFHPEFGLQGSPNRGYIYVSYRFTPGKTGVQIPEQSGFNRISRFTVADGATSASLNSELVMIHQYDRQQWHIGGDMFFGSDGFLYISVGDEGSAFPRLDSTQRVNGGLWSGILRIDVNNDPARSAPITRQPREPAQINVSSGSQLDPRPPAWPASFSQGYSIPLDNPFRDTTFNPAQGGEASKLGEFYAIGMRHPWTISQDPDTGFIWYADVGENNREEIGRVIKGGNHQWPFLEGLDYAGPHPQPAQLIGTNTPPVLDYSSTVGKAVIGAGVYRGSLFPELQGKYLFSDFMNGQLWAIDATTPGPIAMRNKNTPPAGVQFIMQLPAGFSAGINAHLITRDGRLLMAKSQGGTQNGGTLLKLVRQGTPTPQPPALLSQTGAFQDLASLTPAPGFIPYSLVEPFWSDNALKYRWVAIPNDGNPNSSPEKVSFSTDGKWILPPGSVVIKHFEMVLDQRNPSLTTRLETRFLIHANDGWYGITYRWNPAGTDAELLFDGQLQNLPITDTNGVTKPQPWTYPSRNQCMTCHTPAAGDSLGLLNRQLNKQHFYVSTGRSANQLETFSHLGIFETPVTGADLTTLPTLKSSGDSTATLEQRARSYLDSNCSYCHQPGGVRATFDARFTTPLASTSLINGSLVESLGISGAAVVSPGNISKSILHLRAASLGEGHSMPPIAKGAVDRAGVAVIADWIHSLAPANGNGTTPLGNNTSTGGNFNDAHHPSLFVNKSDAFTNTQSSPVTISLASFSFFATKKGNPVTPFAAIVSGTDSFTVAAIGTTRPASSYQPGQNHFLFSNSGAASFTLAPGATFVTGFMDSHPDGTGWGSGSVIPATTTGTSEDDVWALLPDPLMLQNTPFNPTATTPKITLNQTILATNAGASLKVYPNLKRSYKFSMTFTPAIQAAAADASELIVNGSFENTNPQPATWLRIDKAAIPGWDTNSPAGLIEIWKSGFLRFNAKDGGQLAEMDANTLEQTIPTVPGATLYWSFHHRGRDGADTVALDLGPPSNPARINTFTTGKNAWVKYQGSYLVPPGQTQTKLVLVPIAAASSLISSNLIDLVSVKQSIPDRDGDGIPDHLDAFPDDPSEWLDTDGDGTGDNSDPFPLDPTNGTGSPGDPVDTDELITNGSFENTTPKPSTWLKIDKAGVPGWNSNSPLAQIEIWKSGFLKFNAKDGSQFAEMDGNTLQQTLTTLPGATLNWSFHHRGRDGADTVALDIGPPTGPSRVDTFTTGKNAWVKCEGTYTVPPGQTQTAFTLVPISGASHITSANLIDQVSVIQIPPGTPPDDDDGGVNTTPVLLNGSFEQDLESWTHANVAIVQSNVHSGTKALNLKTGFIEQSLTGLTPGVVHTLYLAYRSQPGITGLLGDALITLNGAPIGEIHNASTDYIDANGFEFIPTAATATLRIQSLETGTNGLLIDSLRLVREPLPTPPSSPSLVNGSFENQTGLSGNNPHPTGFELPGWLVTRENVDAIKVSAFTNWTAVDGAWVLDLGGHGPGGIAQTVNGLVPGSIHDLSFSYARHRFWDQEPILKAEVYGNGSLLTTLQRNQNQKVPNWTSTSIPVTASADGSITIEFRSISKLVGGGIIIDDVELTARPSTPVDPDPDPETPPESLGTPTLEGLPGNHVIRLNAPRAGTYILERSIDLIHWQRIHDITTQGPEQIEFSSIPDPAPGGIPSTKLFYRIGLLGETPPGG